MIGPVVDVMIYPGKSSCHKKCDKYKRPARKISIIAEVAHHLGNDTVRCIAMSQQMGNLWGTEAIDTGV